MTQTFTLIESDRSCDVPATLSDGQVRIEPAALQEALGWELKPEGLCRDAVCVPITDRAALESDAGIDLEEFANAIGYPLATDLTERVAALGVPLEDRAAQLATLEAPDFTLPDLEGVMHSLSDHLGKKVLLIAYASW